jgi:hypothetical protein
MTATPEPIDSQLAEPIHARAASMASHPAGKSRKTKKPADPRYRALRAAEGTEELVCLAGSPRIANAFARASAAVERTGLSAVPAAVRELIRAELPSWDGSARGPGRAWVDVAVSGLPDADRPAGRLALLTAFASYSLLDSDVMEARSSGLGDAQLIGLTSWASLAAAMQIGSWLGTQHATALPVPSMRGGR